MYAVRHSGVDRGPIESEFKHHKDGPEKRRLWALASEMKRENEKAPFQYPVMECYSNDVITEGVG